MCVQRQTVLQFHKLTIVIDKYLFSLVTSYNQVAYAYKVPLTIVTHAILDAHAKMVIRHFL